MRQRPRLACLAAFLQIAAFLLPQAARAQAGFEDDRVMLQGFYWESYRHGHPQAFPAFGPKRWYEIVADQAPAIRQGRFDLVWLPPPSFAGDRSAGYNPKEYFNLANSYGSFAQHRAMLTELLTNGVEPVADVVINHRDGSRRWADFRNPDWGTWAITSGDEAFFNAASEVADTPRAKRGAAEERPIAYAQHGGTTYGYGSFRDLDHTSERVRRDVIRYLLQLKSIGYRGWRYDMVHGFHARWVAVYNRASGADLLGRRVRLGQARRAARLGLAQRRHARPARHREQRLRLHDDLPPEGPQGRLRRRSTTAAAASSATRPTGSPGRTAP